MPPTYAPYELEVIASPDLVRDLTRAGLHIEKAGQMIWEAGQQALAKRHLVHPDLLGEPLFSAGSLWPQEVHLDVTSEPPSRSPAPVMSRRCIM